jgi:hypothetical protein
MSAKKRNDGEVTIIDATDPDSSKGSLKAIGGSKSDHWNNILVNQAAQTLWIKHSDKETLDRQYKATVSALVGIGPKDEVEGMIAAQLLAAHNAAMECYRRAMISEQSFEGRREALNQANRLSARMRLCSTHSTATAARASRRSRSSMFTFILAGRPSWGRSRGLRR